MKKAQKNTRPRGDHPNESDKENVNSKVKTQRRERKNENCAFYRAEIKINLREDN